MLTCRTILLTGTVACCGVALARASERTIQRTDLPPAVQRTADAQSTGATVRRYVKDNEGGHVEYEVEMTLDGHSKDVSIALDGTLLEIEEQVALDAIPGNVRKGLVTRAGGGTITKVESITKLGKIVAYEAQVRTAGKHSEIQVGPDGSSLAHEE